MMRRLMSIAATLLVCWSSALFASPAAPVVTLQTSQGEIAIELDPQATPQTVANFLRYVDDGSYVGTQFHRVIPGFVVQGGGLDADLRPRPEYAPVKNESANGLSNRYGSIAMARTSDPDSATRQFYINISNNTMLDNTPGRPGYAVFGKVIRGMDVVEKMAAVPTRNAGGMADVPVTPIVIEKVSVTR
ncbi:peptidylprolyl isomerase [Plesiomonas shigelloides]|uniref:peptidylprolyl isomerase n=1 Tax=Plesiomonas shigelloides TaxID=703 RepID=UPI001C0414E6|nr:peptidylprolyl isomerase [Plesiomonas shigelloides]QWK96470.1 peptidylprolyl isomerase [Plesiomonas shigelloides]